MKCWCLSVLLIATCSVNASAAESRGSENAKRGGTFKYNLTISPPTLNPLTAHDNYSVEVVHWMVESLLGRDEDTYEWVPKLAESYEVSPDQKTFTFQLRKGVRFHDGSEMTAEDVRFSFEVYGMKIFDTTLETSALRDLESIEILGPLKIRIRMKTSIFDNLAVIASLPILPKAVYGNRAESKKLNRRVVATGPYRFKEFEPGLRLSLEANPNWWGRDLPENRHKFNFGAITVRFASEDKALISMLEKGDLDYSPLRSSTFAKRTRGSLWGKSVFAERVAAAGNYTTQTSLFLNLRLPLFKSRKLRRALQLVLNRKWIGDKMFDGLPIEATGPWHRLSEYADPSVKPVAFDEGAAIRLLHEEGWSDSDHDGILDKMIDGKKVDLRFTMMIPKRDWEIYLSAYQQDLKRVGIDMQIKLLDWTLFTKNLDDLNYEAFVVGRGYPGVVDFNPKPTWYSANIGKGDENNIGYQNLEVDKILETAERETNRAKRINLLRKAYRLIAEDQPQIFWFSERESFYGRTSRVKFEKPSYRYLRGIDYWWLE